MNKILKYVGATALAFGMTATAFAATSITHIDFPGSGPNATVQAGDSVDTKVTFDLTGSSELESLSLQIVDNAGNDIGMPQACFDVADRIVAGTFTRVGGFDTTGGTEGTFGIRVRAYGVPGPGTDNNCGGTVNDNQYFPNRLTLTEDQNTGDNANNTGGTFGGSVSGTSKLDDLIALLGKLIKGNSGGTPAPTGNAAKCSMIRPFLGATPYEYTSLGVQLQSVLLLDNPNSIPALHAGATIPMGYFGPQTHAALAAYNAMYGCN